MSFFFGWHKCTGSFRQNCFPADQAGEASYSCLIDQDKKNVRFQWHRETRVTQKCLPHFSGENQSAVSGHLQQGTGPEHSFCHRASGGVGSSPSVFTTVPAPPLTQAHGLGKSQRYAWFVVLDLIALFVFWACVPCPKLDLLLLRWPGARVSAAVPKQGSWWEQLVSRCQLLVGSVVMPSCGSTR